MEHSRRCSRSLFEGLQLRLWVLGLVFGFWGFTDQGFGEGAVRFVTEDLGLGPWGLGYKA